MTLSVAQFKAWLNNPLAIKCTLVEVSAFNGYSEQTFYLSNRNYVTKNFEVPSDTAYLPILSSSVEFTEVLSTEGNASLSYGDISIDNNSGEYDIWATYVWVGRPIKVYMGDVLSPRSDFTLIFSGILDDIAFSGPTSINLSIRDILQRLNAPITDSLLGSYGTKGVNNQNKEQIIPLVFGEVHNITPLLVDDVLLEYKVHNGEIEGIIEVRDNGIPVMYSADLANGSFTLTYPPVGAITCSIQGDRYTVDNTGVTILGYENNIPKLIQRIITGYGNQDTSILASETNLVNFNSMASAHPQPAGVYISDRANILDVCYALASSIGLQLTASREGIVSLVKLTIPTVSTTIIDDNTIILNSLQIKEKIPVRSSIKLGYCKNWTVQTGILTGILEEHKDLFGQEYLTKTVSDAVVKLRYKQSGEPEQFNTLLLSNSSLNVELEATRRLMLYKEPRFIYSFTGTSKCMSIALGDMITLYHYRFGLTTGKYGIVTSIAIDWDNGITKLEVLV